MSYEVYCPLIEGPLLVIPEDHPPVYSTKPLKWIRYAAFVVLGVEGNLMKYTGDVTRENDLTLDMENKTPSERKLMFHPISPVKFVDERAYYSSPSYMTDDSESQESFQKNVRERDKIGVGLEYSSDLKFWHIIPSEKGSEAVCNWRNNTEEIDDINDIRNGVLLDFNTHIWLASGILGVLRTPNFALAVDEVLPVTTRPHQDRTFRFTPHCFAYDSVPPEGQVYFNHLIKDFRYPTVVTNGWPADWPPAFLWDFHYGVVIAKRYGNRKVMDTLSDQVRSYYDCEEVYEEADKLGGKALPGEIQSGSRDGEEQVLDAMDNVLSMSMLFDKAAEKPECRERERRQQAAERVDGWRTNVGTDEENCQ